MNTRNTKPRPIFSDSEQPTAKPNFRIFFIPINEGPATPPGIYCGTTFQEDMIPPVLDIIAYPIPKGWGIQERVFVNRTGLTNYLLRFPTVPRGISTTPPKKS